MEHKGFGSGLKPSNGDVHTHTFIHTYIHTYGEKDIDLGGTANLKITFT